MAKYISFEEGARLVKDGAVVMVGGFMTCGTPLGIIDALMESGAKNLTIICNDAGLPDTGAGRLIDSGRVSKLIASHIGLNPTAGQKMNDGSMEVELVPQGTLAERIRSAGAGLGGFLTPTGIGTIVAEGKQVISVDGRDYLLEKPLKADVAILSGYEVDRMGNVFYRGSANNFNQIMATAADIVIVEADNVLEVGGIRPEDVHTPGLFVDYVIAGGGEK